MLRYGVIRLNLISKKDLLAITGISYGQLYRWKREHLIPEEWFIKQSAYTGQETFFPREQMLSRIKSILDLKDTYSLEELARLLSPEISASKITVGKLKEISEIDPELPDALPDIFGREEYDHFETAFIIAVSQAAKRLGLTRSQTRDLLGKSVMTALAQKNTNVTLTVIFVGNEYHTVFSSNAAPISFDDEIEVKEQIHLSEITDTIKLKYKNLFL